MKYLIISLLFFVSITASANAGSGVDNKADIIRLKCSSKIETTDNTGTQTNPIYSDISFDIDVNKHTIDCIPCSDVMFKDINVSDDIITAHHDDGKGSISNFKLSRYSGDFIETSKIDFGTYKIDTDQHGTCKNLAIRQF